jgi:hypothetical protein
MNGINIYYILYIDIDMINHIDINLPCLWQELAFPYYSRDGARWSPPALQKHSATSEA